MYADPIHIRNHVYRVRFDGLNEEKINDLAPKTRRQPSTLVHDLAVIGMKLLEKHNGDMDAVARAL